MAEHALQRLVQILIIRCPGAHVAEQLRRKDKDSLLLNETFPRFLGIFVRHVCVIEGLICSFLLTGTAAGTLRPACCRCPDTDFCERSTFRCLIRRRFCLSRVNIAAQIL